MKNFCQLIASMCVAIILMIGVAFGQSRSDFGTNTIPNPFVETGNPREQPAISTGYFFMDNAFGSTTTFLKWKPETADFVPLTFEPHLWYRIYSGPRQVPANQVETIAGTDMANGIIGLPDGKMPQEGLRYFRNPAQFPNYLNKNYTLPGIDTVDAAIAGPIPLGFAFYFNGIRYDSFYVSPKGIIALSNRRYFYNSFGERSIPPGRSDAYDPMSADWFVREREYAGSIESVTKDAIPDNYGFKFIACGGDPTNEKGGIRDIYYNDNKDIPASKGAMWVRLEDVEGSAYISPMEGNHYLPQFNEKTRQVDDFGQVWYKRSVAADKLIIYFKNLQLKPAKEGRHWLIGLAENAQLWNAIKDGRPFDPVLNEGDRDVVSGSCQVVLDRIDSSITFKYDEYRGTSKMTSAFSVMQPYTIVAVGGYARHKNYDSKDPSTWDRPETDPWADEYIQVTHQWNGYIIDNNDSVQRNQHRPTLIAPGRAIKFKQWKNTLKLSSIQYFVKAKEIGATEFDERVLDTDVQDNYNPFEIYAGHEILGEMQPVGLIQNLSNDIQGPQGVNFVEQDFQFQARFRVRNRLTDKYVHNRYSKISNTCLRLPAGEIDSNCSNDAYASVRFVNVEKPQNDYIVSDANMSDDQNGIPPYKFVQVKFPRFRPNEYIPGQIGLMELEIITEAIDPNTHIVVGDDWPFDDTGKVDFWVINRITEFRDNVNFNSLVENATPITDASKWVYSRWDKTTSSVSIEHADDQTSMHPVPPLGFVSSLNDQFVQRISPMIKMSWAGVNQKAVGSKITSFPIDLRSRNGSLVTLSVQRGMNEDNMDRGFSDGTLIGPEIRVAFNEGYNEGAQYGRFDIGNKNADFDYIAVEFLKPSVDGVKAITNTGGKDNIKNDTYSGNNSIWRYHPHFVNGTEMVGTTPVQDAPALAIYGGGGYFVGWSFANGRRFFPAKWNNGDGIILYDQKGDTYDNSKTKSDNGLPIVGGFVYNPYDAGFDREFYKYSVLIPDYFIDGSSVDLGKNFRFRIKMVETNDGDDGDQQGLRQVPLNPTDDRDIFLIDNIALMTPNVKTDIEATVVKIIWPYKKVPASQASDLEIVARVTNVGTSDAIPFTVKVKAFPGDLRNSLPIQNPNNRTKYCRTTQVSNLAKGASTELTFSQFSPRDFCTNPSGSNKFTLQLIVVYPDGDLYDLNDTTVSVIDIDLGDEIAYGSSSVKNDVDASAYGVNIPGKGLSLLGTSFSGYNASTGDNPQLMTTGRYTGTIASLKYYQFDNAGLALPWVDYVAGGAIRDFRPNDPITAVPGIVSGQIAVKFELTVADTLRGVRAMFARANQAFDDISFHVYADADGVPGNIISNDAVPLYAKRLLAKSANGTVSNQPVVDDYVQYEFSKPIRLEKGIYWVSIDQRGETGLELAASAESMGMRTTLIDARQSTVPGIGGIGVLGNNGIQLLVDKRFRIPTNDKDFGRIYVNNNVFAYKNVLGSANQWRPFMPTRGHVAFAHLDHFGELSSSGSPNNSFKTFTRGTWMPLIKPYFGFKAITLDTAKYPCPDDIEKPGNVSVEITAFDGYVRNNAIELTWETASEINNHSFIIERANVNDELWQEVNNVRGAGNSTNVNRYRYVDNDVVSGNTYKYRLYQMDMDGTISCQNSNIVTVEFENNGSIELAQNSPNPFNNETEISFYLPTAQNVTLEVVDIFGKIVKSLVSDEMLRSGNHPYRWNGTNDYGMKVADGNYIYRLTVGNEVITKKMSFVKSK